MNRIKKVIDEYRGSLLAGVSIGLGGVIFLQCENRNLGAFLFSIGLFTVLVFGLDLYTGKVCFTEQYKTPKRLLQIWIGIVRFL